ncbi:GNAT family N-acetyltransferase [Rodentibacter caecimuris]|uniref:tRNA(Met) cytidine acetyltransferase TmcA n=1 Tax=Rodentibacter caecimuris TaxID=1796644 RepID=A0ABX3L069_9PAST|nr:tRNA(Met) cytidine acetyltransferase [Rodentibacter heylii]
MLSQRRCYLLVSEIFPQLPPNTLIVGENGIPFKQTTNLLGQEFDYILFDARQGIHLEALAIAAGTLKAGGTFLILLSDWETLAEKIDLDSQRWNDLNAISTPNFIRYFKHCIEKAGFPILYDESAVVFSPVFSFYPEKFAATESQQQIIQKMLKVSAECYLLTAKRGRGKSALAGFFANHLTEKIYLTAANKNAVKILTQHSCREIEFIAPDELAEKLISHPDMFKQAWLFVDEAAMLPLAWLQLFARHFRHILFITTLYSYEGTGRGFELKFRQKINRTLACFELEEPLRWAKNDLLELFIEDLLLLNVERYVSKWQFQSEYACYIANLPQSELANSPQDFYGLLSLAHYRTTPTDLRRLFDANNQQFYSATINKQLIGGVWALQEGKMSDLKLIEQIQQGKRRPRGNLVPQLLCFHANLPQACQLTSLRISRIALLPHRQRQGIGSQLIEFIKNNSNVDFLSVSFGYTKELAEFWQKNEFVLVYLGEHLEASSGCYTAIGLLGISRKAKYFVAQAKAQFQRNIGLSEHPLSEQIYQGKIDWNLDEQDWLSLKNFAEFNRTLTATIPAIQRLLYRFGEHPFPLSAEYCRTKKLPINRRNGIKLMRAEILSAIRLYFVKEKK